jgi:imidazolonepropionase-like amidohydrolase
VLANDDTSSNPDSLVIRNVRVFDGTRIILADSVLVRCGVIAEVGMGLSAPPDTHIVDGAGGTLLPGLIDSHVHALRPENLVQALAFGVTTELDMFCVPPHVQQLRETAATRVDAADFRSAGIGVTAPGGHPTQLVTWGVYPEFPTLSGPEQAEGFVAARVAEGVDYIKVFVEDGALWGQVRQVLSAESVRAVISAAHAHRKLVLVHADSGTTARMVLDAGADALAHHPNDPDPDGDLVDQIAHGGRFVIPTLRMPAAFAPDHRGIGNRALLDHPDIGPYLDPQTRHFMTQPSPFPPGPVDLPKNFTRRGLDFPGVLRITRVLHEAGVPLLAGTDAIPVAGHGVGLHRELELLVEAGLTPAQALAAATSVPAGCFGLTDRGRIEPGLAADLLLVHGDPTDEITATRNIRGIWRRGAQFDRVAYYASLRGHDTQHGRRTAVRKPPPDEPGTGLP